MSKKPVHAMSMDELLDEIKTDIDLADLVRFVREHRVVKALQDITIGLIDTSCVWYSMEDEE